MHYFFIQFRHKLLKFNPGQLWASALAENMDSGAELSAANASIIEQYLIKMTATVSLELEEFHASVTPE